LKACIFDLDGVIVDTAKYHFLAWRRLAEELGITLTEEDNERLKGVGRLESLEIILSLDGRTLPKEELVRLSDRKNVWFVNYIESMRSEEIFPGAKELFQELKKRGCKIGLASSSKNAQTVLTKLGITETFDTIVDGTMIKESKPDPEIFLTAAANLSLSPEHCIVVEDAEAGVEAAKRAGMKCVGIGKQEQLNKADAVVEHIGQLSYEFFKNL
jgi:beta-phosphoglucomutase